MSEVVRKIKYDDNGRPVLEIRPKNFMPWHRPFAVRLDDIWQYTPDKNPKFIEHAAYLSSMLCEMWQFGIVTSSKLADIMSTIEDGIDELIQAKPRESLADIAAKDALADIKVDGNKVKLDLVVGA